MVAQALRRLSVRGSEETWVSVRVIVGLETLLAVVLGLVLIGDKSFWLDEARSVALAQQGWSELWELLSDREANQGLYFVLLRPWLVLGDGEAAVRSLSVIFSAATIPLVYLLASRLFDSRAGLVAGLLMAANGFFVHYAQEARAYSLALMLVTASSYLFVTCLVSPSPRRWAAYALVSGVAVYAHFFAGLVIASQALSLLFLPRETVPWKGWLAATALAGLIASPLGLFVIFREGGQLDWVPVPSLRDVPSVLVGLSGGRVPAPAYFLACAGASFAGLIAWRNHGRSPETWRYAFLLSWIGLPLVAVFAVSQLDPVFYTRFFMICLPALVVLAAAGLCLAGSRLVFGAGLTVFVVFSLYGVLNWYFDAEKHDWRGAAGYVLESSQTRDAVVFFSPSAQIPFDYYRDRLKPSDRDLSYVDYALGEEVPEGIAGGSSKPVVSAELGAELARRYDRVWLVLSITSIARAQPLEAQAGLIERELEEGYREASTRRFIGISVVLYERR